MPTIKDIAPESVFTIELNAGTPGRQGPKGEQGIQGIQGPKGETGPKPIRGIDYFTQQDISNMVTTVTASSNSAFNENVANKTKEFNVNVSTKTSAFDNNAMLRTEEFNANANSKKTDFNLNANNRTTEFNTNASNKKNEIDNYVGEKQNAFDKHVENKVNEFKEETSEYVTETELNSKGYLVESDLNDYAKEEDLFSGSYNDLKDKPKIPSKTSELTNDKGFINEIPSEYVTEEEQNEFIKPYNERIEQNEKYISELEATIDILTNTDTKKGELVHITDALPLPTFETTADGNVEQETTRGINICPTDFNDWESGHYAASGNKTDFLSRIRTIKLYPVQPNTKYYCTCNELNSRHYGFIFRGYDIDNTFVKDYSIVGVNTTFTTDENTHYLGIVIYNDDDTKSFEDIKTDFTNGTIKPFICLDSVSDKTWEKFTNGASPNPEYPQEIEVIEGDLSFKVDNGLETTDENYQEQIVPLDLKGNWVGAINDNIKDYLVTDKRKYWLDKSLTKEVLNGEDNPNISYISYDSSTKRIQLKFKDGIKVNKDSADFLCSHYRPTLDFGDVYTCVRYGDIYYFYVDDTINSVSDWNTKLKESPMTMIYPLAQPYTEELGELPEPIKTFEGTNNIQLLANLDTEIEVKYALDVKKYYDNKLAEISAQII